MGYILSLGKERFNARLFTRKSNISRSTTNSRILRLQDKGLLEGYGTGCVRVTSKGKKLYEASGGRSKASRYVCRTSFISNHKILYIIKISDMKGFIPGRIDNILPIEWRKIELPNRSEYVLYFDDATIVIKTNQINLMIHDIVQEDTDSAIIEKTNIFFRYLKKIESLGIITSGVKLVQEHYARVKTAFAQSLEKIDDKYYIDLGDGRKFFIDHSDDNLEEETNDEESRTNLDKVIKEACNGNLLKNVEGLIEIARMQLQKEALRYGRENKSSRRT